METIINNVFAETDESMLKSAYFTSLIKESIDCYRKIGRNDRAAELLEKGGLLAESAALYSEIKNYKKAGELFAKTGN